MEYLKLGEIFKINVNNKTVYLKVESYNVHSNCSDCYFNKPEYNCSKASNCHYLNRKDNTNIIYKEINPIQDIFVVFGQRRDGFVKQCGAYPTEEDAKKKVEELNRYYFDFAHHYEKIQYYPYGRINDIKEIKL